MKSKEYLEHICKICDNESCPYIHYENSRCSYYGFIKQDLDRLEKLEKVIEILKKKPEVLKFGLEVYKWDKEIKSYFYNHEFEEVDYEGRVYSYIDFYTLTKEEYELLKEVLNYGR